MATPENGIYVLQGIVPSQIAAAPVGVKVVDLYDDNGDLFSTSQVAQMESGGGKVLGYFSIGEAENYRPYWSALPSSILGPQDPSWPGDYQVAYWTPQWLTVSENYIQTMINQGYNGAFFDVVDEAEQPWAIANVPGGTLAAAEGAMVTLIQELANYARAKDPNFQIWINSSGAEDMLANSTLDKTINGAYEEQLYYQTPTQATDPADLSYNLAYLDDLINAGKSVVAVEYASGASEVSSVESQAKADGLGYYIANPNQQLDGVDTQGFAAATPVTATIAEYLAAKSFYDQTRGGFAISDTAANITDGLNLLLDPKINTITISNNGAISASVAQLTADARAIGKLHNANGTAYQLAISDRAAAIVGDLSALNANGHVVSITATSGAANLSGRVAVNAKAFSLTGSTTFSVSENLTYSGSLSIGAGSSLKVANEDTLTLKGTFTIGGTVTGPGTLALAGGSGAIAKGASFSVTHWSIWGSGTNATLSEALSYSGAFSEGAGATLTLTGGALTLLGSAKIAGGTLKGSQAITTQGATTVSGLTIGGTVHWNNAERVIESHGNVTVGDSSGAAAILTNETTGVYDIADNSGIGRGSSTASSIANAGLIEKTGGTGTSVIVPAVTNMGTIEVTAGTLDFKGAVSGTGTDTISGASKLEFDSTLAARQTIDYLGSGGTLDLTDPLGYGGSHIENFAAHDSVDLAGAWSFLSFSENSGGTLGTLTLQNGANDISLEFAGDYKSTDFSIRTGTTTTVSHT